MAVLLAGLFLHHAAAAADADTPASAKRPAATEQAAGLGDPAKAASGAAVDGERAYRHVETLVALGPRPPGSEALRISAEYIEAEIRKLGLTLNVQTFEHDRAPGITFRNLWTELPGQAPDDGPVVIVAAHYDTKLASGHRKRRHNFDFVGALDGGSASGLLVELARVLGADAGRRSNVWLVWFDGEESLRWVWDPSRALFGSRHFAATMNADPTRFPDGLTGRACGLVLLDLIGDHQFKFDLDFNSDERMRALFAETAKELDGATRMFRDSGFYIDDHMPFRALGVPTMLLIDQKWRVPAGRSRLDPPHARLLRAWWHTENDNLSQVSTAALEFTGNLVLRALPKIEDVFCPP